MSKPCSTLPNPVESKANFVSALEQIGTEVDHQPLRSSALARIMRETFHGSGAWDWRMAYDLMQAAAIQVLLRGEGASGDIDAAKLLASRLLTETRRSEQQIRLQQFSTPLAFATMAVRAAAIRKGETVLEPSAGTGALAAIAARAGATLVLNEIDPFRQRLLRAVFGGEVTGDDGEHIDVTHGQSRSDKYNTYYVILQLRVTIFGPQPHIPVHSPGLHMLAPFHTWVQWTTALRVGL